MFAIRARRFLSECYPPPPSRKPRSASHVPIIRALSARRGGRSLSAIPHASAVRDARDVVEATSSARRILVVDDHPDTVDLLSMHIELLGHVCRTASCGAEALAVAAQFAPDIALVDLGLPDIDGCDLGRQLRAHRALYLVAVTGFAEPSIRTRARDAGFDRYVVKPLRLADLRAIIASAPG